MEWLLPFPIQQDGYEKRPWGRDDAYADLFHMEMPQTTVSRVMKNIMMGMISAFDMVEAR